MKVLFSLLLVLFLQFELLAYEELDWYAVESFLEETQNEEEVSETLDIIEYFIRKPIFLRHTTANQLSEIPTIDIHLARQIISLIESNPEISYFAVFDSLKLSDLQRRILYFTTSLDLLPKGAKNRNFCNYSARSRYRGETVRGIEEKKYLGDEHSFYQKFHSSYENFEMTLLTNKNSGERYLAEMASAGAKYSQEDYSLIIGDFSLNAAFGNVFGSPFFSGKSILSINSAYSYSNTLKLNGSTISTNFLRGAAGDATFKIFRNKLRVISFYSDIMRPATIDNDRNIATAIYTGGYFRTPNEISKKNALRERSIGGVAEYSFAQSSIGALLLNMNYSKELISSSSRYFSGKSNTFASIFANISAGRNMLIGGEFTSDFHGETATKIAMLYRYKTFSAAMHYRNFAKNFRSPFGSNFGEFSSPANEEGLFAGFAVKINRDIDLSAYIDFYKTHGRTYFVPAIVRGTDITAMMNFKNLITDIVSFRLKNEIKTDRAKIDNQDVIYDKSKTDFRIELSENIFDGFIVKLRFDGCYIANDGVVADEIGKSISADIRRQFGILEIKSRMVLFSSDSYSSAIWHYEYRMPGSAMANALFDEGNRFFFALKIAPHNWINVYFAYTRLEKYDSQSLGSSYEQIKGNKDNRFYLMLAIKI